MRNNERENTPRRIFILPPEEARRIAAGEVVDRPAALVREFLDNAIDSLALNIEVSIEEGGCKKVEVTDDGGGMSREDLEFCSLAHATSKIRGLDDLDTAVTLGFRGEALAAAAAVSRLEIISSADGREAWQLITGPGENHPPKFEQTRRTKGTSVRALSLFENIPARKRFLKREGSEAALCRQSFTDKTLAFNKINFRFTQDGRLKDFFPAVPSKKARFAAAFLNAGDEIYLNEINAAGNGFNAAVVIGGPELFRSDRRQLFVFANGRRVQDYSLIQAMEYGVQGFFPNGSHPIGAVFVEIDPALADFNIHPAKREVRFRDSGSIHHAVSGAVKSFFHKREAAGISHKNAEEEREQGSWNREWEEKPESWQHIKNKTRESDPQSSIPGTNYSFNREKFGNMHSFTDESPPVYGEMKYAGRVFSLFILIEWAQKLYIIDQHAAHERILYNRFLAENIPKQPLLSPIPFITESDDDDRFLELKRGELSHLGVDIEKDESGGKNAGAWRIEALPADWRLGDAATVKEILSLKTAGENMAQKWAAACCCHAAIKDGDYPDDETAFALGKEALQLPDPRCPHGRPIWTEISRDALFKAVRRN
ncbi:MAG: DNA mismatch repair endonuclease MutL [Treponema sp.]|jgi:DNA mismatch repair protein MutL|nr:DNA mismatch repair endonuclease MutL [Treponema sp.]